MSGNKYRFYYFRKKLDNVQNKTDTMHVLRVRDVRSTRGWRSRNECCWVLIGRSQLLLASQMNLRRSTAGSRRSSSLTLTFQCHLGLGQLSVYCVVRLLICIGARRSWTTHLKRSVTTTTMMKPFQLSNYTESN